MSDATRLLTTIDDYLLSLADGIALAQSELSRVASAGPPGRQFSYYMPKLDFELRMKIQVVEDQTLSQRYEAVRQPEARDKHLLFSPADPATTTHTNTTTEVLSVIKGSFVAVPANDGLPAVVLGSSLETDDQGVVTLTVQAKNAAGEALPGLEVQFNIDREESAELSQEQGVSALDWSDTWLGTGVVRTDAAGQASTTLTVGATMPSGAQLAVVLDAASRTELIVYQVS